MDTSTHEVRLASWKSGIRVMKPIALMVFIIKRVEVVSGIVSHIHDTGVNIKSE